VGGAGEAARCGVARGSIWAMVPSECSAKVTRALGPASVIARWPAGSKVKANGTVPGSEFTAGLAVRVPPGRTPNTSTLFPLALVVTVGWAPSGENPDWAGGVTNCGLAGGLRCRRQVY